MDFPGGPGGHYPYHGASEQNQQQEHPQQDQHPQHQQHPQPDLHLQHQQHLPQDQHPQHQQQRQHQHPEQPPPPPVGSHPLLSFQNYPVPHHVEAYFPGPYHPDHLDFSSITPDQEDFDGSSEILTRPRLTKEQVEVLEAQFQAHPKPNSNVKRHLALQTSLTLPRVANWFQNRRAKAKQMKKQEEFEMAQGAVAGEAWTNDRPVPAGYTIPLQINTAAPASRSLASGSSAGASQASVSSSSAETSSGRDATQEASWASLQRALDAANNARHQYQQDPEQFFTSLPYRDASQAVPLSASHDQDHFNTSSSSSWVNDDPSVEPWNMSSQPAEEGELDYRFVPRPLEQADGLRDGVPPRVESPDAIQGYVISADVWTSAVPTPTSNSHAPAERPSYETDSLTMPCFPPSTNHSPSDELTTTLGQFVLTGTPPTMSRVTSDGGEQSGKAGQHVDIAARRKAPRPAALGSAALRSQSYGDQRALSPTFRVGRQSQNPQSIRHAKSVGQNLNVKYAGIRKPSPAQRSPLNIATFAEADELNGIVARKRSVQFHQESGDNAAPPTPVSSEETIRSRLPTLEEPTFSEAQENFPPPQYFVNGQPSRFSMVSPPSTPLKPEFFSQPQVQALMPPASAPPQYAFFPNYTPPYSAGPLTASSWSDAPLTSPEIATFPPAVHMASSQQQFNPPAMPEYAPMTSYPTSFTSPPTAEPKSIEVTPPANRDQMQTEFLIHEFPRQKEEHARAAQQMASQKPKNYVFANATPNDF